jgi:pimeloyl-ACP methyl ester carboxylesterase
MPVSGTPPPVAGFLRPFVFEFDAPVLADLRARIHATRLGPTDDLEPWLYGVHAGYLRELLEHWLNGFDWDAWLATINCDPQYLVRIDGVDLHFRRIREATKGGVPLLLLHGWPGSFLEFDKVAPALVERGFDLVIPSLPGIGFSSALRPMTKQRMAELVHALMTRVLGYERFGVHGGDVGSGIATRLGYHHGDSLIGIHLTYLMSEPPDLSGAVTLDERRYLDAVDDWYRDEGAYWDVQATKPMTLGYALNDSPAGLLAWILDKYRAWSDSGGDVESRFTRFELLSLVSLYWFTETIGSSMSLYFDNRNRVPLPKGARVEAPTAVALFPNEFKPEGAAPRSLAERTFNVVRWRTYPNGGHFAALEEPVVLVDDIADFFASLSG